MSSNTTVRGDILDTKKGVIVHQANCQGVMGAGLALQIIRKWPQVFADYLKRYVNYGLLLGDVVVTEVEQDLYVASLCGQKHYGRRRMCYTDYSAVEIGLRAISALDTEPIYIPFQMGCGLAGGQWPKVTGIINTVLPQAIVVRL